MSKRFELRNPGDNGALLYGSESTLITRGIVFDSDRLAKLEVGGEIHAQLAVGNCVKSTYGNATKEKFIIKRVADYEAD